MNTVLSCIGTFLFGVNVTLLFLNVHQWRRDVRRERREAEALRRAHDEQVVCVEREIAGARSRFDELDSEVKARMNAMRGGA